VEQLTKDHKPEDPEEMQRIVKKGGIVAKKEDKYGNEFGPYRIWNQQMTAPGLMISRSIGDMQARDLGCISLPDIKSHVLTPQDKILVLGSDGLYQNLSNQAIADIVYQFY
jgi:serine/threonine protein phosphatase PrpC